MKRLMPCAALLLAVALTVAGCGRKRIEPPPPGPTAPPPVETTPATPPPPPPPPAPAQPAAPTEEELFASKTLQQLNDERPLDNVFFVYDSVELTEQSRASLQKNLTWLKRWTSTTIMVEGHADSRGTNEYNLALGERRAASVRDYLVSLGLPANRITTVSKGEEQPVCTEENEDCWRQNRRGHFIITAK